MYVIFFDQQKGEVYLFVLIAIKLLFGKLRSRLLIQVIYIQYQIFVLLLNRSATIDMSNKVLKISQSQSFSEQIRSATEHKKVKHQFTKGFGKELPSLNRFQTLRQNSQLSNTFTKRVKTEEIAQSRREVSPSDKQITRFIYKHLHKKITFQQKLYGDLESASYITETPEKIDTLDSGSRRNTLAIMAGSNKMKPHIYGYQKSQSPDHRQSQFKKPLSNLKQRMLKNHCLRSKMLSMSLAKRRYKKQTHIDAYFDLSCLERIKQSQQKDFLLTNL